MIRNYTIIVCTYNGAYFISQQLESILMQTIPPSEIIISDDHSSDNTLEIVQQICQKFQFSNLEIRMGKKLGVVHNFLSTIAYAKSEYIFLADQDDIWLPNKAEEFLNAFAKLEQNQPTLVFSDASLIDGQGNKLSESFFAYQGISKNIMKDDSILYRNCVQGASCAINRDLQQLVVESLSLININNLYMHDWWIALLARYYGQYQCINKPLLEYRQHGKNQVGVFNKNFRFIYYITRFKQYLNNFKLAIKQVKEFEDFTQNYTKKKANLLAKEKRVYVSVSKLKVAIIKLLRI